MFQQHQGESLYDAWTRFKNLIQRVPHHGLNLWSLAQFFYDHVNRYTQIDIDYAPYGNLRRLSAEEAWETIEDFENEVVRVKIPKCMAWLDDEPIRDLNTMEDKVDNPSPQNTPQVLPSFEVYTQPVIHPKEVEETIGIPMEVEPLDHMKLEDLRLDTSTHDLFLSSKEITHKIAYRKFFIKETKTELSQSVETASRFSRDAVSSSIVTTSGFS
ncbi:hypothetical protein Tco_1538273 [Tanacetum coccineum]